MADVSIDASVVAVTARAARTLVFTTPLIGYQFYLDGDGVFGYSKTTDGGATWGAQVDVDGAGATTTVAFDVWFDKWTPGDTGTLIHCWWFDVTNDVVRWRTLDSNGDTLGTVRTVLTGASAVAGRGAFVSGTKTRSGYLYCAFDLDAGAERGLHRSVDSGTTWSANLSTTFVEATLDTCLLFPASGTGDNNDCWAVYYDASATALTLKLWDSSAGSATESATIQTHTDGATDLTGQFGFAATVRHSDGHIILVAQSGRDAAGGTDQVFDITDTSTITTKTAIVSSGDDHYYPQVFIDQNTGALRVAYNGKRDGSETLDTATNVYYTVSTDGGTTWSAGDTAYREGAAGVVLQVWTPLMGPRFYASWRVGTTLLGNKVNSRAFLTVSVSDAVTLAESVSLRALPNLHASESITVAESLTVVFRQLAVHAADAITVADVTRIGLSRAVRQAEAVTVADAARVGLNLRLRVAEGAGVASDWIAGSFGGISASVGTSTTEQVGQTFTPLRNGFITAVSLHLRARGSLTDNLTVSLASGVTVGTNTHTVLASATILGSDIPSAPGGTVLTTARFATPVAVTAGVTTYAVFVQRTGSPDNTNYVEIAGITFSNYYSGGIAIDRFLPGNWFAAGAYDFAFDLHGSGDDLFVTDAARVGLNLGVVVAEAVTVAESAALVLAGIVGLAATCVESVTVADVARVGTNLGTSRADAVTVAEFQRVGINLGIVRADAVTVAEGLRVGRNLGSVTSEAITVAEFQRVGTNLGTVRADAVTVADVRRVGLNLAIVRNDAVTVADVRRVGLNLAIVRNDVVTVVDGQRVGLNLGLRRFDAVTVADSARVGRNLGARCSDVITVIHRRRAMLNSRVFGININEPRPILTTYPPTEDLWGRLGPPPGEAFGDAYGADIGFNAGVAQVLGQPFMPPVSFTLHTVGALVAKEGAPVDGLVLTVRDLTALGAVLATSNTIDAATLLDVGDNGFYRVAVSAFVLDTPVALTAGHLYWLHLARTGAANNANFYHWMASTADLLLPSWLPRDEGIYVTSGSPSDAYDTESYGSQFQLFELFE